MTDIESCFADNYIDSRQCYLDACREKGLDVRSHVHPLSRTTEVELATDTVYVGDDRLENMLILSSGIHGPELMCGSGCQTGQVINELWRRLPARTGLLFIHALNPWGAANLRRNTEDNIDLARNFIDFSKPPVTNGAYMELHDIFCKDSYRDYRDALKKYVAIEGKGKLISTLMQGQYTHPDGFSFGGKAPCWSNILLCKLLKEYALEAKKIFHIDYHSGIGPYGYGMAVCMQTGRGLEQARDCFGEWVVAPREATADRPATHHAVAGHPSDGIHAQLQGRNVVSIVLEFGTFDAFENNLDALMDEHWFTFHGCGNNKQQEKIKAAMLKTHYPDDPEWRYAVWTRSEQVIRQAINSLGK